MIVRELLERSFRIAVEAADPMVIVPPHVPRPANGRTLVIGAGKAAAAMAAAVEANWPSDAALEGLVVTRYGHAVPTRRIEVVEASHPVPDAAGEVAARRMLAAVNALSGGDRLLALISGGGSALLACPAAGVSIEALRATTRDLLRCGASIQEINTVRKHLSAVQGGRLAAACRGEALALIISDVAGDDSTHIASGPLSPDPTTFSDALAVLQRYSVQAPQEVQSHLIAGAEGDVEETPKPGHPAFSRVENRIIATAQQSLQAAARTFREQGITAIVLGDTVTGEAREVAKVFASLVRQIRRQNEPWRAPVALLSGGELTVTVSGNGRGGRCSAFLLALAVELDGMTGVHALACDTDGIDGTEGNAGAVISPDTLARARASGISAREHLSANDSFTFFDRLGDLIVTGPTLTNVNDYRVVLVT